MFLVGAKTQFVIQRLSTKGDWHDIATRLTKSEAMEEIERFKKTSNIEKFQLVKRISLDHIEWPVPFEAQPNDGK